MTRPDLDAIEARVSAATAGPWISFANVGVERGEARPPNGCSVDSAACERDRVSSGRFPDVLRQDGGEYDDCVSDDVRMTADATFIAAARTDIPALVAYIRELEVALLNERGEGEPPAPGWSSAENSDGALWWRDIEVDEDGCPVDSLLVHPSEGGTCAWERWVNRECLESGSAATAREAMVAADAALEVK